MAGLILADFGADVIRVDRVHAGSPPTPDFLARGKRSIAVDTKVCISLGERVDSSEERLTYRHAWQTRGGNAVVRRLVEQADVLIDPFRPGVMERLGLGPDVFLGESGTNKGLVYARLVGFPRSGAWAFDVGGHVDHSDPFFTFCRSAQGYGRCVTFQSIEVCGGSTYALIRP